MFVTHGYTDPLAKYLTEHGREAHGWRTQYEGEPETLEAPAVYGLFARRSATLRSSDRVTVSVTPGLPLT